MELSGEGRRRQRGDMVTQPASALQIRTAVFITRVHSRLNKSVHSSHWNWSGINSRPDKESDGGGTFELRSELWVMKCQTSWCRLQMDRIWTCPYAPWICCRWAYEPCNMSSHSAFSCHPGLHGAENAWKWRRGNEFSQQCEGVIAHIWTFFLKEKNWSYFVATDHQKEVRCSSRGGYVWLCCVNLTTGIVTFKNKTVIPPNPYEPGSARGFFLVKQRTPIPPLHATGPSLCFCENRSWINEV